MLYYIEKIANYDKSAAMGREGRRGGEQRGGGEGAGDGDVEEGRGWGRQDYQEHQCVRGERPRGTVHRQGGERGQVSSAQIDIALNISIKIWCNKQLENNT